MGHIVERTSFAELNKLTTLGSVVPALFWVIPLGEWYYKDLDNLWHLFTGDTSYCNEYYPFSKSLGLLLVERNLRGNPNGGEANLSGITAKLEDLLPEGINTIYNENEFKNDARRSNKFLILTGNYPQPGWGLFVNAIECSYLQCLDKIELFLKAHYVDGKILYEKTQKDYFNWNKIHNNEPKREKSDDLVSTLKSLEKILPHLNLFDDEINNNTFNLFNFEFINKFCRECYNSSIKELISPINQIFNEHIIFSILIVRLIHVENINRNEITNLVNCFYYDFDKQKNNLYKLDEIKKSSIRRYFGSHILKNKDKLNINENTIFYYEEYFNNNYKEVYTKYSELVSNINSFYVRIKFKIDNFENEQSNIFKAWLDERESLRGEFQNSIEKVLEFQNKESYKFLYNLEIFLNKNRFEVKSFSWDPPRMIGWKLLASGLEIENYDIISYIKDTIPDFSQRLINPLNGENLDGNSFTDYIHYFSIYKSNLTPRLACKEILTAILRRSDIRDILSPFNENNSDKIETILNIFGWPYLEKVNLSLASCIHYEGNGQLALNNDLKGNEIRKVLENFCKDFIDVLISKLELDSRSIEYLVKYEIGNEEIFASYKRKGTWNNYISHIMLGEAIVLINKLLHKAYPNLEHKILLDNIVKVKKITNPTSHDNPNINIDSNDLAQSIFLILKQTHDTIAEMPWHFTPLQKNGILPVVFTGRAWSHSYPGDKQISLILWDYNDLSNEMLIWNPDKRNPVMPNAKKILRPR